MKILVELIKNEALISMILSFVFAQTIKGVIQRRVKAAFQYGGMPSGHSALVTGLGISTGLTSGFNTPLFALSLAFAMVTISDAVRFRARVKRELGHTWLEVLAGCVVGFLTALFVHYML